MLVSDLAREGQRRWPGFGPAAYDRGVRAVLAFPLQVGAVRFGSLDVYRDTPGPLPTTSLRDAFTFADVAVRVLLDGQDAGEGGSAATCLTTSSTPVWRSTRPRA